VSLATVCRRLATLVGVQPADTWIGDPDLTASEIVAWVQEAQQQVAAAHDWSSITASVAQTLPGGTDPATVALPAGLARIIPDSVHLDHRHVRGALNAAEWDGLRSGIHALRPAYTLRGGKLLLTPGSAGGLLSYSYVMAVPDYQADPDETVLGAGVPEFVVMFEGCILYAALAAYRDSKGLPAGTAAATAAGAISDAKARDLPIGAMSMVQRRRRHLDSGIVITGVGTGGGGTADLSHAILDDFEPDDDPLSDDLP
jgi:hypothetical protein